MTLLLEHMSDLSSESITYRFVFTIVALGHER